MFPETLIASAKKLLRAYEKQKLMLATAESCTGGLIAALLTEIPGSSAVFERGFVTYSNAAKSASLGVPAALIRKYGAVSAPVAEAMAQGVLTHSKADVSIAVTGVAGPAGGTKQKPVGLVYIAVAAKRRKAIVEECLFKKGSRSDIRLQAATKALLLVEAYLSYKPQARRRL
jgi:nicotinamide-nucleotide amidase